MTIPEKTGVWTVSEAVAQMARQMQDSRFLHLIEQSADKGEKFEAILVVKKDENGYMVNMTCYESRKLRSLGTLLRIPDIA